MRKIALIPYACGAGAGIPGCGGAPEYAEQAGLDTKLKNANRDVKWREKPRNLKDAEARDNLYSRENRVQWHLRKVHDMVKSSIEDGETPVVIGGDHSVAAGSIAGLSSTLKDGETIGVIWVDAHPDINTLDSSDSGNYHGMPIAALLGIDKQTSAFFEITAPVLKPENIFYLGIRSIDPSENTLIGQQGIAHLTAEDVKKLGLREAFKQALHHLRHVHKLVMSFDLDSLNPDEAPAVGTPVENGLSLVDVVTALNEAKNDRAFDMVEIVEFNPSQDGHKKTYTAMERVLDAALP